MNSAGQSNFEENHERIFGHRTLCERCNARHAMAGMRYCVSCMSSIVREGGIDLGREVEYRQQRVRELSMELREYERLSQELGVSIPIEGTMTSTEARNFTPGQDSLRLAELRRLQNQMEQVQPIPTRRANESNEEYVARIMQFDMEMRTQEALTHLVGERQWDIGIENQTVFCMRCGVELQITEHGDRYCPSCRTTMNESRRYRENGHKVIPPDEAAKLQVPYCSNCHSLVNPINFYCVNCQCVVMPVYRCIECKKTFTDSDKFVCSECMNKKKNIERLNRFQMIRKNMNGGG